MTAAAVISMLVAPSAMASARHRPTLGERWNKSITGIGTVRPSAIGLGGDPTGFVRKIHWHTWGGARVTGTGRAVDDKGGVTVAKAPIKTARIVAFDLGICNGRPMYQGLEWYFPQDGAKFNSHRFLNICDGDRPGERIGSMIGGVYPQKTYPACTARGLAAGLTRGTAPVPGGKILRPHGCYGSFAYSAVSIDHNEVSALFLAHGQHWATAKRTTYCSFAVPDPIYQPACNSN